MCAILNDFYVNIIKLDTVNLKIDVGLNGIEMISCKYTYICIYRQSNILRSIL